MKLPFPMKPMKHPFFTSGDYYNSPPPKRKTKRTKVKRSKGK